MNLPNLTPKESSHKYTGTLPRQRNIVARVEQLGCLKKPVPWTYQAKNRLRISLLAKGNGTYHDIKGRNAHVKGPSLILFRPEEQAFLTPDDSCNEWLEYYFIYHASFLDEIYRIIETEDPIISFCLTAHIQDLIQYIHVTQKNLNILGAADRLDMLAQALLAESSFQLNKCNNPILKSTLAIRDYLDNNFLDEIDFEEIASEHGISMVTLRRYWSTWIGDSPNRYLHNLRMQYAIRLILETDIPLGTIAQKIGFKDPLYFSRRFHDFTGLPASEYRNQYKITAP